MINSSHATIQTMPPNGVIIPTALIPEIASTYREPEKRTIPARNKYADHFRTFDGLKYIRTPTAKRAKV